MFTSAFKSSCVYISSSKHRDLMSFTVTSELMFEQYSVPGLTYCIDSVMSFYHNQPEPRSPFLSDGLVISFNTASTSVLPVLGGKAILSHAKRFDPSLLTSFLIEIDTTGYPGVPLKRGIPSSN